MTPPTTEAATPIPSLKYKIIVKLWSTCTEDEKHFMLHCYRYAAKRVNLFSLISSNNDYLNEHDYSQKVVCLMTNENLKDLKSVSTFIVEVSNVSLPLVAYSVVMCSRCRTSVSIVFSACVWCLIFLFLWCP
jgi:hypothetical protein